MTVKGYRLLFCLLLSLGGLMSSVPTRADVVFPARLEIKEIEPGRFEVVFVLPVIQGKVLKAQPILPEACKWLTEPQLSGDVNVRISRWQVTCPSDSLHGQKFGIEGLLGSQVDILFNLEMLNGRSYQTMLSPVNAFFVVPDPPGLYHLIKQGVIHGLRSMLNHGPFYLLILVVFLAFTIDTLSMARMVIPVVIGYLIGQQLSANQWLMVPDNLPELATWLATLILSISILYRSVIDPKFYGWLLILLGTLYGSTELFPQALQGYDSVEYVAFNFIAYAGIALAVVIIYGLSANLVYTIEYLFESRNASTAIAYLTGIAAVAGILYNLSPYVFALGPVWSIPWLPILFVVVFSLWVIKSRFDYGRSIIALLILLSAGFVLSESGITWDWAVSGIIAALLLMIIHFVLGTTPARWINLLVSGFVILACGYYVSHQAEENLSYANAQTVGFIITLVLALVLFYQMARMVLPRLEIARSVKQGLGIILIILLATAWFQDFSANQLKQFIADHAVGQTHIPLISLVLIILAFWFWPKYKPIHKSMGLKRRPATFSLFLLGISVIVYPWVTLKLKNPFSNPGIPDLNRAELVVQQVLSNTYHAFNLEDEDELYEQLALSVDQELIEDIYLDSRRKLRAGVRQGAEVLVKEVEVLDLDQASTQSAHNLVFETTWVVTARVKHLQHIHHRKNQYSGSILLKTEGADWKISGITLTSEDRTILPNTSG